MLNRFIIVLLFAISLIYPCLSYAQDNLENTQVFLLQTTPFSVDYPNGWEVMEIYGGISFTDFEAERYISVLTDFQLYFLCDIFEVPVEHEEVAEDLASCLMPSDWTLDDNGPTSVEILGQQDGLLYYYQNADSETSENTLTLIIPYMDDTLGIERYVVLWAMWVNGSLEQMTEVQNLLVAMAETLKIGNEVVLETASVRETTPIVRDTPPDKIYSLALTNAHLIGLGACGEIVEISLEGTIISTIEQDICYDTQMAFPTLLSPGMVYPASDGSVWVLVHTGDDDASAPIYHLLHMLPDGTTETKIELNETFTESDAVPSEIAADSDGHVFVVYTITYPNEGQTEVHFESNEIWIQVWSSDGEFQYQFLAYEDEYASSSRQSAFEVGPDGLLYLLVSDLSGMRVFDTAGNLIADNFARNAVSIGNVARFRFLDDGTLVLGVSPAPLLPIPYAAILHLDVDGQLLGIFSWDALGLVSEAETGIFSSDRSIDFYMNDDGELVVLARSADGLQVHYLTISSPEVGS